MTVVEEWHVTGDATVPGIEYGPYHFVYRSDDCRWDETGAEQAARTFVERCLASTNTLRWRSGPHLFHRTVTYSALAPVPVEQETPR